MTYVAILKQKIYVDWIPGGNAESPGIFEKKMVIEKDTKKLWTAIILMVVALIGFNFWSFYL